MRLTNRGRGLVMGLMVSAIGVTGWTVNHSMPVHHDKGDCQVMVSGTVTDKQWDDAVSKGWQGIPGDGMEALWSPECGGKVAKGFQKQQDKNTELTCPDGWEYEPATFTCELSWTN